MRALIDATVLQLPETGVGRVVLGLYRAARHLAPELQAIAVHRLPLAKILPAGLESWPVASWLPPGMWRRLALPGAALRLRPAVIHFPWNGHVPRLPSGPLIVTTIHDVLPLIIPDHFSSPAGEEAYRARLQRDIDRTDLLLTDSEYSKRSICERFAVSVEPVVIYPGVARTETSAGGLNPEHPEYFLYVGGYHRRKGLEALLRVFLALRAEGRLTSKLVLTGTQRFVSEEFSRLLERGRGVVSELGYLDDIVLRERLARAKALVYPSKYEGFGLPPLEAMAAGCPVLTTRGTSIPEVCGDAALYFDPDDDRSFATALDTVEHNAALRADLRSRGLARAQGFSWNEAARRYLASLQVAGSGPHRRRHARS
jgi:glycosyltransferase involved in cell wall biosynthesis